MKQKYDPYYWADDCFDWVKTSTWNTIYLRLIKGPSDDLIDLISEGCFIQQKWSPVEIFSSVSRKMGYKVNDVLLISVWSWVKVPIIRPHTCVTGSFQ